MFNPSIEFTYLSYWILYDLLLKTGLAFGMVLIATERVRDELEERNRRLAEATAELARAARTDPLTGLLNRRALEALVEEPPHAPFAGALAVLDVNDLKPLNDRYGHQTGDAALQVTARALRTNVRVSDPIFRTGGDEFLVVLPGGTVEDLAERMAHVDAALQGLRLPGCSDSLDLRAAWGVAEFASASELWQAVQRADAAMYAAKMAMKKLVRV